MRFSHFSSLFLILPVVVLSELHDYEDFRDVTPSEYLEQFDMIVDDLSITEEETNRKLIVLAGHFQEQETFRRLLLNNVEILNQVYKQFMATTQRIQAAKYEAQAILANRTQSAEEQYDAAVRLDKRYPLEMSVLLDICASMGYPSTKAVIASSLRDIPKTRKLAADLEEYTRQAQATGYSISQQLHDTPFLSRRDRLDSRKRLLEKYPKAMVVHDHVVKVLSGEQKFNTVI
uniref:DUF148 domain-containing protein n=1 Tax=Caenorhabditis japonica TaxID=281687 RepID=A0A8R1DKW0_CAEJA